MPASALAVAFGQHQIVRNMVKSGVDINTPTGLQIVDKHTLETTLGSVGMRAMHAILWLKNYFHRDTALHLSSRKGNEFMTSQVFYFDLSMKYILTGLFLIKLLEMGADVNTRNTEGDTPLHDALRMCDPSTTKLLIRYAADPKAVIVFD